jgi:hypothetical protein
MPPNAKELIAKSLERCMKALVPAGKTYEAGRLGVEVSRLPLRTASFLPRPMIMRVR